MLYVSEFWNLSSLLARFYGGFEILPLLSASPQSPLPSIFLGKTWEKMSTKFINVDPDPDLISNFFYIGHFFHVWLLAISLIFQLGVAVYKKILKEQQVLQFCQNSSPRERFTGLVREYREAAERHCPHWLQQRLLHRLHPCLHPCLQHMAELQADRGTGES